MKHILFCLAFAAACAGQHPLAAQTNGGSKDQSSVTKPYDPPQMKKNRAAMKKRAKRGRCNISIFSHRKRKTTRDICQLSGFY